MYVHEYGGPRRPKRRQIPGARVVNHPTACWDLSLGPLRAAADFKSSPHGPFRVTVQTMLLPITQGRRVKTPARWEKPRLQRLVLGVPSIAQPTCNDCLC